MKKTVTQSDVKQYEEQGYLMLHRPILPLEKFERLKSHSEAMFAAAAKDGKQPALIDCPHWRDPLLFEWIFAPELLDIVEPLIGPDIGVFASHLLQKPAAVGKRVPWHEDSAYWNKVLDPMIVASITIAIEPSLPENGCLRVIPGTHKHGYSDYAQVKNPDEQVFGIEIKADQYDESKAVDIALQPNEASIHNGRIIHGSNPNTGTRRRAVFTVRYFPTHVKFRPKLQPFFRKGFHIYLARGKDKAGNRYSDPTVSYEPNTDISTA